jgi:hypothetical protein
MSKDDRKTYRKYWWLTQCMYILKRKRLSSPYA